MSSTEQNTKNRKYLILLAVLVLFHIFNNYIIVSNDNTPLLWDGGDYFLRSLKYYDVFANLDNNFVSRFNEVSPYRPPLFMLTSLPFYFVFGKSTDVAVMTNFVFLAIMLFSVYGIGKRIHSHEAGLLASFIISTFPILFGLSRSYWLDFPVTAMVCLSMYILLMTDYFSSRKYSLLFGISAGLGMLTKWTYFVYMTGPLLFFLIPSFKMSQNRNKTRMNSLPNVAISILVCIAVASFWYIPNGMDVASKLFGLSVGISGEEATRFQQLGESFGPSGIFNVKSFTYYAGKLVNDQIDLFYALLLVLFTFFLLKKGNREVRWILMWIIISVVAFTLIKNKTARNTVPMLPAVGLIISLGIMELKSAGLRKIAISIILLAGLVQYAVTSYGSPYLPKRLAAKTPIGDIVFFQQHENTSHAIFRAKTGDWKGDEILDTINIDKLEKNNTEIVLMPRDAFTWMAMEYSSYLRGMPFKFIGAVDTPESVLHADYVLFKKGGFVAPWFLMKNIHKSLDLLEDNKADFMLIKSVVLPEERTFLPVYDIEATRHRRNSGVVFAGMLMVQEYYVSASSKGFEKQYTIEMTIKAMKEIDSEIMISLRIINKKMAVLMRKRVEPSIPLTGLKTGEVKKISVSFIVPSDIVGDVFTLDAGFYDVSRDEQLTYQPEYLIYKRTENKFNKIPDNSL